jgi:hypothetical protein
MSQSQLGSESLGTRDHSLLSHIWDGGGIRPRLHKGINTDNTLYMYINIQFVPHRKHIIYPLQRPTGLLWEPYGTYKCTLDRIQSSSMLNQVVHIVTTGLYIVNKDKKYMEIISEALSDAIL